ncbi:hypothetical protein E2493_13675 [Sphingomonas parva]|uniref:Transmembrane protein n=1 Tax=Sphingomonas parva TaxID=2555898 RepID=A0A4Y8ZNU8_9SPHN|nr:hypothetical protein [Sphingomonas parva]TFI57693.1 hypothetical protein E2493_13675 [Sphingomonas parva]
MLKPRRYFVQLGAAMSLYAGLLIASNRIDDAFHPEGAVRIALALSPMIGAVAAAWVILRAILRMDEMQRRIQLEAIAFSFLGTALITFGWGFAQEAGLPGLHAFGVWAIMGSLWGLGVGILTLRYR